MSWTYVTEQIYWSSPAIGDDDTVYIGTSNQLTTGSADAVYALNSDGTLKWRYETGTDMPAKGAPAIGSDGTIYCVIYEQNTTAVHLYALNNSDGSLNWIYENIGDSPHTWGELTPAISSQEVIYVTGSGKLSAIDSTGTLSWIYTSEASDLSSPTIGPNGTIYFNANSGVYAVNPDGTLKWKYSVDTYDYSFSPPALSSQEVVYVGRGSDTEGNTYVYAIDSEGNLEWRFYTEGLVVMSNPAVGSDGTIYVGTTSKGPAQAEGQCGIFFAINPDGSEKWSYDTAVDLAGPESTNAQADIYSSAAIGADGTIYFSSESRYVYALNPDGTVKYKYDMYVLAPASSGSSTITYSSPAIAADGTIYVGDYYYSLAGDDSSAEGAVYALISESEGLLDAPWPRIHGNNKNTGRR